MHHGQFTGNKWTILPPGHQEPVTVGQACFSWPINSLSRLVFWFHEVWLASWCTYWTWPDNPPRGHRNMVQVANSVSVRLIGPRHIIPSSEHWVSSILRSWAAQGKWRNKNPGENTAISRFPLVHPGRNHAQSIPRIFLHKKSLIWPWESSRVPRYRMNRPFQDFCPLCSDARQIQAALMG